MKRFFKKIKLLFESPSVRKRILIMLGLFALYRLLSAVPIPAVNVLNLQSVLQGNQFLGLLNIFSGGALGQLSIIMLGVGPYITSSIIMQLLSVIVPPIKEMYKESGDIGRKKFQQIARLLTVPVAAVQGIGILTLLVRQGALDPMTTGVFITNVIVVMAGALLLMWLGELITEFGVGNGVSLMIFAGIVAAIPGQIAQSIVAFTPDQLLTYIAFVIGSVLLVAGIVWVTEAERPIPIAYAKQSRGRSGPQVSTYLPLKINQAGVMPIIFALSVMMVPQLFGGFLVASSNDTIQRLGEFFMRFTHESIWYAIVYFVLVIAFTFFYTSITFNPKDTASNLQKSGAFIPGIRPGTATTEYIGKLMNRITLVGSLFLGVIAVIPIAIQSITGNPAFAIGGTGLLIVVAVVIDLMKRLDAQASMREF